MRSVTAIWRSLDGNSQWELIRLLDNPPSGEGGIVRRRAVKVIAGDITKWTLPVAYKISTEPVMEEDDA